MTDSIIVITCMQIFMLWLLQVAETINFGSISVLITFFALVQMWMFDKWGKK